MLKCVLVMFLLIPAGIATAQVQFNVTSGPARSVSDLDSKMSEHADRIAEFNLDLGEIESKYDKLASRLDAIEQRGESFATITNNNLLSINEKLDRLMPKPAPKGNHVEESPKAVHPANSHSHRCNLCGEIWWHGGDGKPQDHHCPNCGAEQFTIHEFGSGKPAVTIVPSTPKTTVLASLPFFQSGGGCTGAGCQRQSTRAMRRAARGR